MRNIEIKGLSKIEGLYFATSHFNVDKPIAASISFFVHEDDIEYKDFMNSIIDGKLFDVIMNDSDDVYQSKISHRNIKVDDFHIGIHRLTIKTLLEINV